MIPQFLKPYCADTVVLYDDPEGPVSCTQFKLPNTGNLRCAFLERQMLELSPYDRRTWYAFELHTEPEHLYWTTTIPDSVGPKQTDKVLKNGLTRLWLAALGLEKT
jgi:hypothetical protein